MGEKTPGNTQDRLERLCSFAGIETPRHLPKRAERGGCEKRGLGLPAQATDPMTQLQNKRGWMDGFLFCMLKYILGQST